jgi:phospholipase/carboxylesterase
VSDGLTVLERPAAGEAAGALVVLHGRGADEHDLFPLLDELDPARRLHGYAPRGPLSFPPGGAHWYALYRVGFPDPETFRSTFALLSGWVDAVAAEHPGELWLAGFSQGGVMAYSLGLGAGRPQPSGVLAFSSFVPTVPGFELDLESRAGLPVSIAHGTHDPVIGVEFGRQARDLLAEAGLDVRYREDPAAHTITAGGLAQARATIEGQEGLAVNT